MADQRENNNHPTGLGLRFEDGQNTAEPQGDGIQGQREVEDSTDETFADFDGDFTDDTEQRAEPLHVAIDDTAAHANDSEPQPASAFSPSSSEGSEDEEDDAVEQDQDDNNSEQVEEWHDVVIHNTHPPPPVEPEYILPAVRGRRNSDTLYRVKLNGSLAPMHPDLDQDERGFKRKMEQYARSPSKRRTTITSPPVSPNKNTGTPEQIGVLPEPSPEAEEDSHVVSPLEQHEESESAPEQHASATERVWSEEDEEDTSWVSDAIAEVKGSRRGSAESSHDTEHGDLPEPSGDAFGPLSPVSPLDPAGALDALRDDSEPDIEDDTAASSETPDQDLENSQWSAAPPMELAPVFVTPPSHLRDPTSPDPDGPETLTGLTPQEGIDTWWEWHDRVGMASFTTIRNRYNQDKAGDLNAVSESSDKDEAADVLIKQRFLLNRQVSGDITCNPDAKREIELVQEYVKLQMLKYRHQRNLLRDEAERFRRDAKQFRNDAVMLAGKVGRRDQTIHEQDLALAERERTVQKLKTDYETVEAEYRRADAAFDNAASLLDDMTIERDDIATNFEQYRESAEREIGKARRELGIRNRPLQMASIMTVISQEPVAVTADKASDPGLDITASASEEATALAPPPSPLQSPLAETKTCDEQTVSTLEARYESILREKERVELENEWLSQLVSKNTTVAQDVQANISNLGLQLTDSHQHELQLQSRVDDLARQLSESQAIRAVLDTTCTELHGKVAELEVELVHKTNEELDNATKSQLQAQADKLREQLQKKADIESELAASRLHIAQLQSRKYELEVKLETSDMTRRSNAGPTAELISRVEAADALAQEQQAMIEQLQADNVAWQRYVDESAAAFQAEKAAAYEEVKELQDALMEHGWSSRAPLQKHTLVPMTDQGTQTKRKASSAPRKAPIKAVPAPLRATQKQQSHAKPSGQSSSWTNRKAVIMQQQWVAEELESRRAAREKRQVVELEQLDQIRHRMGAFFEMNELPYVPLESRLLTVAAF